MDSPAAELRVVVVVSADRSDLYFANRLMRSVNVVGVIVENQHEKSDDAALLAKTLRLIVRPHVLAAKVYERLWDAWRRRHAPYNKAGNKADFGNEGRRLYPRDRCSTLYTQGVNDINHPENVAWLEAIRPDVIAVCGASILGEAIITVPVKGVLNLHGGLSQRYRGLFTTDWAIYNDEPEYVGATVHYVTPGIDDGDIVYQGRPEIAPEDNPNSLYVKVVKLGVRMMVQAIKDIEAGAGRRTSLPRKGELYLGSQFTARKRDATWRRIRRGVIGNYLRSKHERDKPVVAGMINRYVESC